MVSFQKAELTETVYSAIRDGQYIEAITILTEKLNSHPRSRAALSILGYCYFMMQNYSSASSCYEELASLYPSIDLYGYNLAICYQKQGLYDEATSICLKLKKQKKFDTTKLLLLIYYEKQDYDHCKRLLDSIQEKSSEKIAEESKKIDLDNSVSNFDAEMALGCLYYQNSMFAEAKTKFQAALTFKENDLKDMYNLALCAYKLNDSKTAMKTLNTLLTSSFDRYPQFKESNSILDSVDEGYATSVDSPGSRSLNSQSLFSVAQTNSIHLKESVLIEAYNLKLAIYFDTSSSLSFLLTSSNANKQLLLRKAKFMLKKMPKRHESELDPVTLHNVALLEVGSDLSGAIRKLSFLLENPPFPDICFKNLLIIFLKNQYFDFASELFHEHEDKIPVYLEKDERVFFEASLLLKSSPDSALSKFESLLKRSERKLKKLLKDIHVLRRHGKDDKLTSSLTDFETEIEKFVPILMSLCKIYWDGENYKRVERILRRGADLCTENKVWQLNLAHCFFMQQNKYKESVQYYSTIVENQLNEAYKEIESKEDHDGEFASDLEIFQDEYGLNESDAELFAGEKEEKQENRKSLKYLDIQAIILANLCVSYIMISENEKAEEIMRKVELAEDFLKKQQDDAFRSKKKNKIFHLCIINLVIGTLYCSKGNYEFGVSRIIKSMEPIEEKLGTDTWFYVKRGILSLCDALALNLLILPDATVANVLKLLRDAENYGKDIVAQSVIINDNGAVTQEGDGPPDYDDVDQTNKTKDIYIWQESRVLRNILVRLY